MAKKNKLKRQRKCQGPACMGMGMEGTYPPPYGADYGMPGAGGVGEQPGGPDPRYQDYGMGAAGGAAPYQAAGGYRSHHGYAGGVHSRHGYHGYGYGYDPAGGVPDPAFQHPGRHHGYAPGAGPGPAGAFPGSGLFQDGLLQGMPAFLRTANAEQFLLGAVLGATAAWVLADEELRGKLIKAGMKLYAGVAGGFEEMKEQMADIKAEVATERHGDS